MVEGAPSRGEPIEIFGGVALVTNPTPASASSTAGNRAAPSATYTTEVAAHELDTFLTYTRTHASPHLLSVMINGMTSFDGTPTQAPLEAALMQKFNLGNQSHYLEQPETQVADRGAVSWFTDGRPRHRQAHLRPLHPHRPRHPPPPPRRPRLHELANPLSNGRGGVLRLTYAIPQRHNRRLGMGVDGEASADLADPFENLHGPASTPSADRSENAARSGSTSFASTPSAAPSSWVSPTS